MFKELLFVFLITLIPAFELRGSIPYGITIANLNWFLVFVTALISNILLGIIIYFLLDLFVHRFLLRIPVVGPWYHKYVERTQRKLYKSVERVGFWGIVLFVGVPLPGTGSYSGALGAYILGLGYKRFILANAIGVLIAGILVTLGTLGIVNLFF